MLILITGRWIITEMVALGILQIHITVLAVVAAAAVIAAAVTSMTMTSMPIKCAVHAVVARQVARQVGSVMSAHDHVVLCP